MRSQRSFELLGDRVVAEKILISTLKNISSKSIDIDDGPSVIRNDIFLIKVTANEITVENSFYQEIISAEDLKPFIRKASGQDLAEQSQLPSSKQKNQPYERNSLKQAQQFANQLQGYLKDKLINGDVCLRIAQQNKFYLPLDKFRSQFAKQIKPEEPDLFISNLNDLNLRQKITSKIPKNILNLVANSLTYTENEEKKRKSKATQSMSKMSRHSLFKINLSSFKPTKPSQKDNSKFKFYQQSYKLRYKRDIPQRTYTSQKSQIYGKGFTQLENEQTQIYETRPNLKKLFQNEDSIMFTGTKDSLFEIKFEENELNQTVQYLKDYKKNEGAKLPVKNIFSAKFKLKEMCEIPFVQHQVTINLNHKLGIINQGDPQYVDEDKKIKFTVKMSLFMVPGNGNNGWGILKIDQMKVDLRQFFGVSKQKKLVKIKIDFPDVIVRNKQLKNPEQQKIETKVLSLQPRQNPFWTEDLLININPQKNKMRITLHEMNSTQLNDEKSIIAEKTIDLLEEGFLFDRISLTKTIKLESSQYQSLNIFDLTINFNFELVLNDYQKVAEKHAQERPNAFINHLAFL